MEDRRKVLRSKIGQFALFVVCALATTSAVVSGCVHQPHAKLSANEKTNGGAAIRKPADQGFNDADTLMFHLNRKRLGWKANEEALTTENVSAGKFGIKWSTPQFESVTADDSSGHLIVKDGKPVQFAPHLYASPLYMDRLTLHGGKYDNRTFSVVFAATSNGVVYAVNAANAQNNQNANVAAGTVLWKTKVDRKPLNGQAGQKGQLGTPVSIPNLDGNIPLGILGTPVIDASVTPPRMYVAAVDQAIGWQVFALDLSTGQTLWQVPITEKVLHPLLVKGDAHFQGQYAMSQRGALLLSKDGHNLFVPFGAYNDGGVGYMVLINTNVKQPKVTSAFAADLGTPLDEHGRPFASGGMWSAGGAALDDDGGVYSTTGNSGERSGPIEGTWGQSLLKWTFKQNVLHLENTYTPFNYCQMDVGDIDMAGSSPIVIDLDPNTTSTPHLLAFGGKQGNVYLLDRDKLSTNVTQRPPCEPAGFNVDEFKAGNDRMNHPDPVDSHEQSLFDPAGKLYNGRPGPLHAFLPYQENFNNGNFAKMRTTPAYFVDSKGDNYVFVSGTTRANPGVDEQHVPPPVPPSLLKLKIVTEPGKSAFLEIAKADSETKMLSPGSPIVTSNGSKNAIVWVIDANVPRVFSLVGPNVPKPILYAYDAGTLKVLWRSNQNPGDGLQVGGKYAIPAVANGQVFVGTDRIQAFGL